MLKLSVVLVFCLSVFCAHAERIRVVAEVWPGFTELDGSGLYLDVARAAFAEHGAEIEVIYLPYARGMKLVATGRADVFLGVYLNHFGDRLIYSDAVIDVDQVDAVVSPELDANWQGPESLAGKRVVAQTNYDMDRYFDFPMDYSEAATLEQMLKMLAVGRVDAVLDYEVALLPLWHSSGLTRAHKIKLGVLRANIHFGFSNSDRGLRLRRAFDSSFNKLWREGELKRLHLIYLGNLFAYPGDFSD